MDGSLRVARIFGIPIEIHYTWLLVFGLISWSLATGYFPRVGPELGTATLIALGVGAALLFFAALLLHELAHAYVAMRNGLPVRSITLFIFGGVASMGKEPRTARAEFRMAVAGPLMSILISGVFDGLALAVGREGPSALWLLFRYLAIINLAVAVFNLLPAFPLDGGRIFRSALWALTGNLARATRIASQVGQGFAVLLIGWGFFRAVGGNLTGGLWMAFIGWFLLQAAQAGYSQVLMRRALRGVQARDVMRDEVATVSPDLTLTRFVNEVLMQSRAAEFCVVEDNRLRGVIGLGHVRSVPRERWNEVRVAEAMTAEDQCPTVSASAGAYDTLMLLGDEGIEHVTVRDHGSLVGTITRQDLLTYIRNRLAIQQ